MRTLRAFASSVVFVSLAAAAVSLTGCGGKVDSGANGSGATNTGGGASGLSGPSGDDLTDVKAFPLGTYSNCSWLVTGGTFEGEGAPASTLTVAANGAAITGTFVSDNATEATLSLVPTSARSATATMAGQGFNGDWGYCGGGSTSEALPDGGTEYLISDPGPSPATLSASSIDVTIAGDALFLTMAGPVTNVQGFQGCAPEGPSAAPLNAVLECDTKPTANATGATPSVAPSASAGDAAVLPTFAPGLYDCTDTTDTVVSAGGTQDSAAVGGASTLTLTTSGSVVTAALAGDDYVGGTLTFDPVSANAAIATGGQTLHVACGAFTLSMPVSTANPTTTNVNAGSLTTDGTTLTLIALGSVTTNDCAGQTSSTVLSCTPKK